MCLKRELPVIFTRHSNTKENARMMEKWWRRLISPHSHLWQIHKEFNLDGCILVEKNQYDAFYRTNLEKILEHHRVETVIISGVMTNLCCETTVRSAFVRGFQPYIPIDLTSTLNEILHLNTIINLAHGFSNPYLSKHFLDYMESC